MHQRARRSICARRPVLAGNCFTNASTLRSKLLATDRRSPCVVVCMSTSGHHNPSSRIQAACKGSRLLRQDYPCSLGLGNPRLVGERTLNVFQPAMQIQHCSSIGGVPPIATRSQTQVQHHRPPKIGGRRRLLRDSHAATLLMILATRRLFHPTRARNTYPTHTIRYYMSTNIIYCVVFQNKVEDNLSSIFLSPSL